MCTLFTLPYTLLPVKKLCFRLYTTSKISTMQSDLLDLLRSYLSNFIASVLHANDDLTMVA